MKKSIPFSVIIFRLILGPTMIFLTYKFGNTIRLELAVLLILGLLSDVFDGIIARKIGTSTEKLRRMDSQTDLVFCLCAGYCCYLLNPEIITKNKLSIALIFVIEALTYAYSIAKFGKETCTHALLSKLCGISLCVTFVSILGFGYGGIPFMLAIIIGFVPILMCC